MAIFLIYFCIRISFSSLFSLSLPSFPLTSLILYLLPPLFFSCPCSLCFCFPVFFLAVRPKSLFLSTLSFRQYLFNFGSSVGIVTRPQTGRSRVVVRFLAGQRDFFLLHNLRTGSWVLPGFEQAGNDCAFRGGKK